MTDGNRTFCFLVLCTFALMTAVVLLSAYMRLTAAGLGCLDWPACYGSILAGSAPPRPEWINFAHRIAASIMGVAALAIAVLAWQRRRSAHGEFPLALGLFGLTAFLAALGKWTHDAHLPAVAIGNLLGGLGVLMLLWRLHLGCTPQNSSSAGLRSWAMAGLGLLAAQTALGGMASANFAATSCASLTGCEGWLRQAALDAFNPLNALEVPRGGSFSPGARQQTLHMAHRLFALPVICYIAWLGIRLHKENLHRPGKILIVAVMLQAATGIGSKISGSPLLAVLLHNATAAFLMLVLVTLGHHSRQRA